MALLARQLYFEAVKIGDELPPLVKPPVDRIQIARFAGASQDYSPLHVDEQYAKNAGFPSTLAPGMLAMGFLAELVVDWLRGARLRRFSARFVKIVWPGDVITCRGRVVDRRFEEPGRYAADIEVWAENQRGELLVRGLVSAQLFYNHEDEARRRAGQPPLVVTAQEEGARLARLTRSLAPRRPEPARPAPKAAAAARPAAPAVKTTPAGSAQAATPKGAAKPKGKAKGAAKPKGKAKGAAKPKRPLKPKRAAKPKRAKPKKAGKPRKASRAKGPARPRRVAKAGTRAKGKRPVRSKPRKPTRKPARKPKAREPARRPKARKAAARARGKKRR